MASKPEAAESPTGFWIPVRCLPKQSFRKGRGGGYTEDRIKDNAAELAAYALGHRPDAPLEGPVFVALDFRFRSVLKKGYKASAGDIDNLIKQMLDVLQVARFFRKGDQQVARVEAEKRWSDVDGVRVRVWQ